jgi:hypothetical protein
MILPWPVTIMLALHEAEDHAAEHADLAAALHGHDHSHGTPAHDHSLMPAPSTAPGQSRSFLGTMWRAESITTIESVLSVIAIRPAPAATASPPPAPPSSPSILRI